MESVVMMATLPLAATLRSTGHRSLSSSSRIPPLQPVYVIYRTCVFLARASAQARRRWRCRVEADGEAKFARPRPSLLLHRRETAVYRELEERRASSTHGQEPCDRLGAVVKQAAKRACKPNSRKFLPGMIYFNSRGSSPRVAFEACAWPSYEAVFLPWTLRVRASEIAHIILVVCDQIARLLARAEHRHDETVWKRHTIHGANFLKCPSALPRGIFWPNHSSSNSICFVLAVRVQARGCPPRRYLRRFTRRSLYSEFAWLASFRATRESLRHVATRHDTKTFCCTHSLQMNYSTSTATQLLHERTIQHPLPHSFSTINHTTNVHGQLCLFHSRLSSLHDTSLLSRGLIANIVCLHCRADRLRIAREALDSHRSICYPVHMVRVTRSSLTWLFLCPEPRTRARQSIMRSDDIERELTKKSTKDACFAMLGLPIVPEILQQTTSSSSLPQNPHGQEPCDRLGAVVKQAAKRACKPNSRKFLPGMIYFNSRGSSPRVAFEACAWPSYEAVFLPWTLRVRASEIAHIILVVCDQIARLLARAEHRHDETVWKRHTIHGANFLKCPSALPRGIFWPNHSSSNSICFVLAVRVQARGCPPRRYLRRFTRRSLYSEFAWLASFRATRESLRHVATRHDTKTFCCTHSLQMNYSTSTATQLLHERTIQHPLPHSFSTINHTTNVHGQLCLFHSRLSSLHDTSLLSRGLIANIVCLHCRADRLRIAREALDSHRSICYPVHMVRVTRSSLTWLFLCPEPRTRARQSIMRSDDIERELTKKSTKDACFAMLGLPIVPEILQQTTSSSSLPQNPHGQEPCDRLGAVVKQAAKRACKPNSRKFLPGMIYFNSRGSSPRVAFEACAWPSYEAVFLPWTLRVRASEIAHIILVVCDQIARLLARAEHRHDETVWKRHTIHGANFLKCPSALPRGIFWPNHSSSNSICFVLAVRVQARGCPPRRYLRRFTRRSLYSEFAWLASFRATRESLRHVATRHDTKTFCCTHSLQMNYSTSTATQLLHERTIQHPLPHSFSTINHTTNVHGQLCLFHSRLSSLHDTSLLSRGLIANIVCLHCRADRLRIAREALDSHRSICYPVHMVRVTRSSLTWLFLCPEPRTRARQSIMRSDDIERELTKKSTKDACFAMLGLPIVPEILQQTTSSSSLPQNPHGQEPCDRLGAVVKQAAKRACKPNSRKFLPGMIYFNSRGSSPRVAFEACAWPSYEAVFLPWTLRVRASEIAHIILVVCDQIARLLARAEHRHDETVWKRHTIHGANFLKCPSALPRGIFWPNHSSSNS
ncbi:unnamed protein product, partial [Trichogramma brassicae]